MKNTKNTRMTPWLWLDNHVQQLTAMFVAAFPWLLPVMANADIGDAAKNAGTSASRILYIILIVVGGICLLIAFIMKATGSQRMNEKGNSWLFKAMIGIGGGAMTGLILTWLWNTAASAGGGNTIGWPF